jgi:hypothetical protein
MPVVRETDRRLFSIDTPTLTLNLLDTLVPCLTSIVHMYICARTLDRRRILAFRLGPKHRRTLINSLAGGLGQAHGQSRNSSLISTKQRHALYYLGEQSTNRYRTSGRPARQYIA